jgi:cytosine/adenosine deaminase-related metal-dependent hydrolase
VEAGELPLLPATRLLWGRRGSGAVFEGDPTLYMNNAYLMFLEKETGSLEVGKQGDFIVLDRDILTCDEDAIAQTRLMRVGC